MIENKAKAPLHLSIIGIVSLLWNSMGAFDYTATQLRLEFYMSNFSEEQLAYFYGFPAWAKAFWAVGVWCSLLGSLFLLAAPGLAAPTFSPDLAAERGHDRLVSEAHPECRHLSSHRLDVLDAVPGVFGGARSGRDKESIGMQRILVVHVGGSLHAAQV